MEKGMELYPPFLMPGNTITHVHQLVHLPHGFDGGHLLADTEPLNTTF